MVEVTGLTKRYGKNTVVDQISFQLERGQVYGLLGPNGAGKSTTIKMLTGCLFPTAGSVIIDGHDLLTEPDAAKRCIGYLPERPPLYPAMTPREYLNFMAEIKGVPKQERRIQVEEAMEKTHITQLQNRLIRHLSKGYAQRVGIAQALLGAPPLLIFDEPMVGLDPAQIREIRTMIRELGKSHTVIYSSHILSEVSATCNRVLVISAGRLIANEQTEALHSLVQTKDVVSVTVACDPERAQEILSKVPQTERVEITQIEQGYCTALLHPVDDAEIQEAAFQLLREAGVKVRQIGIQSVSLEDAFLSILSQDQDQKDKETPGKEDV